MRRLHCIIILTVGLIEAFTHFGATVGDSAVFFEASAFFKGARGYPSNPCGIKRPLLPLLTALLTPTLEALPTAYALINFALYPLSGLLCYRLTKLATASEDLALISSIMLLTSSTMVAYGAASYYMGATIFFEFLVATLAISADEGRLKALLKGLLSGVSALSGEATLIYIGFGFLQRAYQRKRIINGLVYLAASLGPPLIVPTILGYSLVMAYVTSYGLYDLEDVKALCLSILRLLGYGRFLRLTLLLAGLSILEVAGLMVGFLTEKERWRLRTFYLMFGLSLMASLTQPPGEPRLVYVLYPALEWMSATGVYWIASRLSEKPLLNILGRKAWMAMLLVINAALTNALVYTWYFKGIRGVGPIPGLSMPL